jgi:hypothetical protein
LHLDRDAVILNAASYGRRGLLSKRQPAETLRQRGGDDVFARHWRPTWLAIGLLALAAQALGSELLVGTGTYLPTERAVRGGHYSATVHSNLVGPEGGQVLVDRTVELIESMWQTPE